MTAGTGGTAALPCGPNADDRYCPNFRELSDLAGRLEAALTEAEGELNRLRAAVTELLDSTGLDDDQRAEWLERAGITLPDHDGGPTSQLHEGDWDDAVSEATQ